jgi:mannose-6-phosphate isomerase-like protein (cupin superfamily)
MKRFKINDFVRMANPTPGKFYRTDILSLEDQAREIGGMFGLLVPGAQVPYHYHEKRESIIIFISGEAVEVVEGKEIPVGAGDVLFIPALEKHGMINRSGGDVRYIEFWTPPSTPPDFVEVK